MRSRSWKYLQLRRSLGGGRTKYGSSSGLDCLAVETPRKQEAEHLAHIEHPRRSRRRCRGTRAAAVIAGGRSVAQSSSMSSSSLIASIFARGTMTSCTVISSMSNRSSRIDPCLFGRRVRGLEHDGTDSLGPKRLRALLVGADAQQPEQGLEQRVGGGRQQVTRTAPTPPPASHRPGDQARDALGIVLAEALGDQFAEDDGEVSDGQRPPRRWRAGPLAFGSSPCACSQSANGAAKIASPTMPESRPIEVMPIWMVEGARRLLLRGAPRRRRGGRHGRREWRGATCAPSGAPLPTSRTGR